MASYTANLASILVAEKSSNGVGSIQDAIDQRLTICIVPQVEMELIATYPGIYTKFNDAAACVRKSFSYL